MPAPRRELPYKEVAAAVPCVAGWLLVSAKLKGSTFVPDFPRTMPSLKDIIERRPPFTVVGVNAPLAAPHQALEGTRNADKEAAEMLGYPVSVTRWTEVPTLGPVVVDETRHSVLSRRYTEVTQTVESYMQRTVYEVVPELSFFQMNAEQPLTHPIDTEEGYLERRTLLAKVPGVGRVLDAEMEGVSRQDLLEGAAIMWTGRRIASRAGRRLPRDAEWDERGLRQEILR